MYSDALLCMDPACGHWHKLEAGGDAPSPRGWLAATACAAGLVVHGGNSLTNARLVGGGGGGRRGGLEKGRRLLRAPLLSYVLHAALPASHAFYSVNQRHLFPVTHPQHPSPPGRHVPAGAALSA